MEAKGTDDDDNDNWFANISFYIEKPKEFYECKLNVFDVDWRHIFYLILSCSAKLKIIQQTLAQCIS